MTKSVRQQILEKIEDAFKEVLPPDPDDEDHVPSDADWPFAFSSVNIGPLGAADHKKRITVGIVAGSEKEKDTYPFIEHNWQVAVEFQITANRGDDAPAILGEQVLTVVKRVITDNRSWGGLAVDTKRTGNELDLTTYGDKTVAGVQFMEVMYRTSTQDPRDSNPAHV